VTGDPGRPTSDGPDGWPVRPFADAAIRRRALAGRVAVVTGASRGLGAGLAAHFASAGLRLGLCARHRPDGPSSPGRAGVAVSASAGEVVTASVDVTDFDALAAFADAAVDRFGHIDLWINNAGVLDPIGPLVDADADVVAGHVATNVTGVAYGTMLFARHVAGRAGGGVLVNVSSGAAVHPYAGLAVYSATKAAVDALTAAVAQEEARHDLRAHAVTPGHVDTAMQAAMRATDDARFPAAGRFRQIAETKAFSTADWVGEKLLELAFAGGEPPPEAPPVRLRVPSMGDAADRPGGGS
jgi:NAD(P)-dependent dehydrogenase (short-subunit alcohol dehydrogenase family)